MELLKIVSIYYWLHTFRRKVGYTKSDIFKWKMCFALLCTLSSRPPSLAWQRILARWLTFAWALPRIHQEGRFRMSLVVYGLCYRVLVGIADDAEKDYALFSFISKRLMDLSQGRYNTIHFLFTNVSHEVCSRGCKVLFSFVELTQHWKYV